MALRDIQDGNSSFFQVDGEVFFNALARWLFLRARYVTANHTTHGHQTTYKQQAFHHLSPLPQCAMALDDEKTT